MKKYMKSFCVLVVFAIVAFMAGCGSDDDGDIAVTAINLDKTELSLDPGATQQLTATIVPSDATNKRIVWSSENEAIATVTDKGLVTAMASGKTNIWVKIPDGTVSASASVTVNVVDYAKDIAGVYNGTVTMNETPAATNVDATFTYTSENLVTLTTVATILGVPLQISCSLTVTMNEEGKYVIEGTGITNDYGYGPKAVTAVGAIDKSGNIVMDLDVVSITETVVYTGKKK